MNEQEVSIDKILKSYESECLNYFADQEEIRSLEVPLNEKRKFYVKTLLKSLEPKVMTKEELQDLFTDLIDKNFPKGECKERGKAIVLIAEAIIILTSKRR